MNSYLFPAIAVAGLAPLFATPVGLTAESTTHQPPIQSLRLPQDDGEQKKRVKAPVDADSAKTVWEYLSGRYDTDGDGKIDKEEYTRGATQFDRLDKDKNGFIEKSDTKTEGRRSRQGGRGAGRSRGGSGRRAAPPTEGGIAPDFTLETLYPVEPKAAPSSGPKGKQETPKKVPSKTPKSEDAKAPVYETTTLSSWKGKKPVALIFGSYT